MITTPRLSFASSKGGLVETKLPSVILLALAKKLDLELVAEYRFAPPRRWRFDFFSPKHALAVEVEGGLWMRGRHARPKGIQGDIHKYNEACLMGYRVIRFSTDDLVKTPDYCEQCLRRAINGSN